METPVLPRRAGDQPMTATPANSPIAPEVLLGKPQIPKKLSKLLTRSSRMFLLAYAAGGYGWEIGERWCNMRGKSYGDTSDLRVRMVAQAGFDRKRRDLMAELESLGDPELLWECMGLGLHKITKALNEGLEATKVIPMARKNGRDSQEIVEMGPYVDHPTRIEAAMSAARLRGDLRKFSGEAADGSGPVSINVNLVMFGQPGTWPQRQLAQ